MTDKQQMSVLYWVELMLSGKYNHCKHKAYDHETGCYCAIGVAMVSDFVPQGIGGKFIDLRKLGWLSFDQWFNATFGLPRPAPLYSTLNDMSSNYLTVASLLLHAVPETNPNKPRIYRQFMEKSNAFNKTRA